MTGTGDKKPHANTSISAQRLKRGIAKLNKGRYYTKHYLAFASSGELKEIEGGESSDDVKISIVIPRLYIENRAFSRRKGLLLKSKISVLHQAYKNTELIIADSEEPDCMNASIARAGGEYIGILAEGDMLHPSALYEIKNAICAFGADFIYTDEARFSDVLSDAHEPYYKPDYSPDLLKSYNYIGKFFVFKKSLFEQVGGFCSGTEKEMYHDLTIRLAESAKCVRHIPHVLYYENDMNTKVPAIYHDKYEIEGEPLVSIIIPTKDHAEDLKRCISSILEKSTYNSYEIIVVENGSSLPETFAYYKEIEDNPRVRVVRWDAGFNFSEICNFGAEQAKGEYILLLNNDTEVISPAWIEEMLMFACRRDVGAVGAMLYYPDDTIQHAGVILGAGNTTAHAHFCYKRGEPGYHGRLKAVQNMSAVTGACMMVRRDVWEEMGGLDSEFAVVFNDTDLCMKIRKGGYLIVWTPYAELYHHESLTRGHDDTPNKIERFRKEETLFRERWKAEIEVGDPYYNPNFSLENGNFISKEESV